MGILDDYVSALQKVPMSEAIPGGAGTDPQGDPTAISNMISAIAGLPKQAIQASANDMTHYGDHSKDVQSVEPAFEAARALTGMVTPFAETNAMGSFGGRLGASAEQLENSFKAEDMAARGGLPDAIHAATDWHRNPADSMWRFEIPDNNMKLNYFPNQEGTTAHASVSALVKHPELLKPYPQLGALGLKLTKDSSVPTGTGLYDHSIITLPNGSRYLKGVINVNAPNADVARSVLSHELQHGIQSIEGFQFGTSPDHLSNLIEEGLKRNPSLLNDLLPNQTASDVLNQSNPLYYRTAGETEARNVQNRLDWTPEKRATIAPWYSQDVPFANQYKIDPVTGMLKALRGK